MFIIPLLGYKLDNYKARLTFNFATFPKGGKVALTGFGTFSMVKRAAGKGVLILDRNGMYPRLLNGRKI